MVVPVCACVLISSSYEDAVMLDEGPPHDLGYLYYL